MNEDDTNEIVTRDDDGNFTINPPQNPGDPGYEPPLIITKLDGEGGTIFQLGAEGEEFDNLADAEEARANLLTEHTEATAPEDTEGADPTTGEPSEATVEETRSDL